MKINKLFIILSLIPIVFLLFIIQNYFHQKDSSNLFFSLFYGYLFPTFNFVLGVLAIHFGFEKSDKLFLIIVFGGLVARLFLMLGLILMALKFLFVSLNSFIFTTFIFYFYYLLVEIFFLTKKEFVNKL